MSKPEWAVSRMYIILSWKESLFDAFSSVNTGISLPWVCLYSQMKRLNVLVEWLQVCVLDWGGSFVHSPCKTEHHNVYPAEFES